MEYIFLIDKTFSFEYFMYFAQVAERDAREVVMIGMQGEVEIGHNKVLPPFPIDNRGTLFYAGTRSKVDVLVDSP